MCARVREREDEREWGGKMRECVCEREKGREDERAREKECERESGGRMIGWGRMSNREGEAG
jgi:hypothetical protein